MQNSQYISLSRAAALTGKSKSVISKALKEGDISYISKDKSGYKIDPSELFRVFPKNDNKEQLEQNEPHKNGQEQLLKIRELELKLDAEIREHKLRQEQLEKLEQEKEDWKKQAQQLLLNPPQKPVEQRKKILGIF